MVDMQVVAVQVVLFTDQLFQSHQNTDFCKSGPQPSNGTNSGSDSVFSNLTAKGGGAGNDGSVWTTLRWFRCGGGHSQKQGGNATQPTQAIVVVMDLVTQVGKDITQVIQQVVQGGGGGGAGMVTLVQLWFKWRSR